VIDGRQTRCAISLCVLPFVLYGCAATALRTEPADAHPDGDCPRLGLFDLAGEWEVEENGVVIPLRMDALGYGTYEWEQGSIQTAFFDGRNWRGAWNQPGNDRNGEFELHVSPNGRRAKGRWWYLRIGDEHFERAQRGGVISLNRDTASQEFSWACPR
jgi:hypothetical protein